MAEADGPALWKRQAAEAAAAEVADGMRVGLGTGSTAELVLSALAARVRAGLRMTGVATSARTALLAQGAGIPLVALDGPLDLVIDGADEVGRDSLMLIKGAGGALLREKIVARSGRRLLIVVDRTKLVRRLGEKRPVPVEVEPFGWAETARRLAALGAEVALRRSSGGAIFVTDGGHHICDCRFPDMTDPPGLEGRIKALTGVIESGLFTGFSPTVFCGGEGGVEVLASGHGISGGP